MSYLVALLVMFPQEEALRKLVDQLASDSIETRAEAFRKLEAVGRPAIPLLERAALDSDGELASRAKILLVRIPIRERLTPALVEQVNGVYDRLARGEWKPVFLELAEDLRQPPDRRRYPRVRPEDLAYLAPMAAERAASEIDKVAICEAVGRLRLRSAMADMVRLLKDGQYTVRANAAAAIRDSGAKDHAEQLRPLLSDPHPLVRSVAAHALAKLGVRSAIPELSRLLRDESGDVRWWAVRALGDLEARSCVAEIERLRSDPDPAVRHVAEETAVLLRRPP